MTTPPTLTERLAAWVTPLAIGMLVGIVSAYMAIRVDVELLKASVIELKEANRILVQKIDDQSKKLENLTVTVAKYENLYPRR